MVAAGNRPDEAQLRAGIARIGREFNPAAIEASRALFAPLHEPSPEPLVRDAAYGPHQRHRLDVYGAPAGASKPVVLFVHGGGFVAGDKDEPDQPIYGNLGAWAAKNGLLLAAMNYRLAPESVWPSGPQDVGLAIAWLAANIGTLGGDPRSIFLFGQSAGAAHTSAYVAHPAFHGPDGIGVAGHIGVSGLYDIDAARGLGPLVEPYYGADASLDRERSAVPQIGKSGLPTLIAVAEFDLPAFHQQAFELIKAIYDHEGRLPEVVSLRGHNHFSEVFAFGLDYRPELANHILDFIDAHKGR